MSDKKNSQTDYTTVKPVTKFQSTAMPESQVRETAVLTKKQTQLTLDEEGYKPAKTRTELYKELAAEEAILDKDVYDYAPPVKRAIALAIDAGFAFILYQVAIKFPFVESKLIHILFLDKYKLQFMFGENAFLQLLTIFNIAFLLLAFIVIPVAFFNASLGKKLTGLRVRGDDKYTMPISQAFMREVVYKPISIACLVGFILPFFDKMKKSLHDKMAGTFVITE